MAYITVEAEICTSDALVQLDSDELIIELKKRHKLLTLIKELLGVNELASKEDIIEKINDLKS